jgi:hypothetical protein
VSIDEKDRADLLFQHYNGAAEEFKHQIQIRTRLTLIALGIVVVLLFRAATPQIAEVFLERWIEKQLALSAQPKPVDLRFITSLLWFGLSSVMVLYFSESLSIERQARYLRVLEKRLGGLLGGELITRYLSARINRPLYFRTATFLYTGMMMILLFLVMGFVLYQEVSTNPAWVWPGWAFVGIDLAITLFTIAVSAIFAWSFIQEVSRPDSEPTPIPRTSSRASLI